MGNDTPHPATMADAPAAEAPKKRTFKKFLFRGLELDALLDMNTDKLVELFRSRARLRKAKKGAPEGEKPEAVRTHLRGMIVVPEMIGSVVGVYNGKTFNQVEVKPEMLGHYLGEFSITYRPVNHGRPGIGSTHSSRFIPLK